MALSAAAINVALGALANVTPLAIDHISLHSADPGATGANELSGGSPAYARKVPTFVTPVVGQDLQLSASLTFDVPAGATVAYFGLWHGSTWYGGNAVSNPESFAGQGQYVLTSIDLTGS